MEGVGANREIAQMRGAPFHGADLLGAERWPVCLFLTEQEHCPGEALVKPFRKLFRWFRRQPKGLGTEQNENASSWQNGRDEDDRRPRVPGGGRGKGALAPRGRAAVQAGAPTADVSIRNRTIGWPGRPTAGHTSRGNEERFTAAQFATAKA